MTRRDVAVAAAVAVLVLVGAGVAVAGNVVSSDWTQVREEGQFGTSLNEINLSYYGNDTARVNLTENSGKEWFNWSGFIEAEDPTNGDVDVWFKIRQSGGRPAQDTYLDFRLWNKSLKTEEIEGTEPGMYWVGLDGLPRGRRAWLNLEWHSANNSLNVRTYNISADNGAADLIHQEWAGGSQGGVNGDTTDVQSLALSPASPSSSIDENYSFMLYEAYNGQIENRTPSASFTVNQSTATAGDPLGFDGSGSSAPAGQSLTYSWEFGDGATGSGETTSHTYGSAGNYTANLTVTDTDGYTDTASLTVEVEESSGGGGDGGGAPTASFTVNRSTVNVSEVVAFNGSASSDPDGQSLTYSWEFGDGATATGENVTHSYSSNGSYLANLTVTDPDTNTDTANLTLTVENTSTTDDGTDDGGSGDDGDDGSSGGGSGLPTDGIALVAVVLVVLLVLSSSGSNGRQR